MVSSSVKTVLVCRHNDVTLIDVKLHGKGSTGRGNSDCTSHSIISRFGLECFCVYKPYIDLSSAAES